MWLRLETQEVSLRMGLFSFCFATFLSMFFCSHILKARSVYLNGFDISSAYSQDLKNVNIHINERGDIFISAPHYTVNVEDSYMPLSRYHQQKESLSHKDPKKIEKPPEDPKSTMKPNFEQVMPPKTEAEQEMQEPTLVPQEPAQ